MFVKLENWNTDTQLWALQVYDDTSEHNNTIHKDVADPSVDHYDQMGARWGYGPPDHMAYQSDPCGLLKAAKVLLPELSDDAWLHYDSINDPIRDTDSTLTLWVHRNYGTAPITPPDTQPNGKAVDRWLFLGSFPLSEEQECPWHGPGCLDHGETAPADCPFCEGSQYVYHGSGYALQVWGALQLHD